ncbi:MAG: SH3 domain-containing protein [Spirochaetes bacterium]|nr:SH3 domain-containing protein [Spirochaetota bacterium]MBP9022862.1 SH3 domain-containing protein [Spirochaetota bacterium]
MKLLIHVLLTSIIIMSVHVNTYAVDSQSEYYKVNASSLMIRSNPDKNSKVISKVLKNRIVKVLENSGKYEEIDGIKSEWVKIITFDNTIGYVFKGYLSKPEYYSKSTFIPFFGYDVLGKIKYDISQIPGYYYQNYPDIFIKQNRKLSINLKNHKTIDFVDTMKQSDILLLGADGYTYEISSYMKEIDYATIEINSGDEYGSSLLINLQNGEYVECLSGWNKISPNKSKILNCSVSDGPYGFYSLKIIDVSKNKPFNLFNFSFKEHSFYKIPFSRHFKWIDDNTISVINEITNKDTFIRSYSEIVFSNNKWNYIE